MSKVHETVSQNFVKNQEVERASRDQKSSRISREIAEILGHKTLKQSMKYCHIIEPHTRGVLSTMANQFLGDMGSKVLTKREYQLLRSKP